MILKDLLHTETKQDNQHHKRISMTNIAEKLGKKKKSRGHKLERKKSNHPYFKVT